MRKRTLLITICALVSLIVGASSWVRFGAAEEAPNRQIEITVPFTEVEWWLTRWVDNQIECVVFVDHDALPTPNEVFSACGEDLYEEWRTTPLCEDATNGSCDGLYLFLANIQPRERKVVIDLPTPAVWLTLSGCTLIPPQNQCDQIPDLVLTGDEPLPNEEITKLHLKIGEEVFECEGNQCAFPLPITTLAGVEIEFSADSSYGDTSEPFQGHIRIVDAGVPEDDEQNSWFVDVLSTQWQGGEIASCAQAWEAFPPVGGPPAWLSTPEQLEGLATDAPYVYLAGQLILQGAVDASECPSGGLSPNNTANTCGLEVAREMVNEWQNRFDTTIIEVAERTNVPAQLMKNLFAIESQFWPGPLLPEEFGFGQITEMGADTALLWNESFFDDFCPLILEEDACTEGYLHLSENEQALLRGAVTAQTDSTCTDCLLGIDLTHAEFSVDVFAHTLLGNCEQAGRIAWNVTENSPGVNVTYEDLWRFTLVNYNAGPGCLSSAMKKTWQADKVLDWEHVSDRLTGVCQGAIDYVEKIEGKKVIDGELIPTATPTPSPAPYPAPSPAPYP